MAKLIDAFRKYADEPDYPREYWMLTQKILEQQNVIREKMSYEFLNEYTMLCNQRSAIENVAQFERGFYTCAQLLLETLSK